MVCPVRDIVQRIESCTICERSVPPLPHQAVQTIRATARSRIRIISQAPGLRAHNSGTPFMDPSGVRLREWLAVNEAEFYDADNFAITPMGFCFPGYDSKGGDLPPRRECAPMWQDRVTAALGEVDLVLLVGMYAQKRYLGPDMRRTLTETVRSWRDYGPRVLPLPHPSWRNNAWLKMHDWFPEVIAHLRERVDAVVTRHAPTTG